MANERHDAITISGGTIVTPERIIADGTLAIRQGQIVYVGPATPEDQIGSAPLRLAADDCWVVPGLIDLHIHGAGGHDAARGKLVGLSRVLAAHGVSGFLPTIAPQDEASLRETVARLAAIMRDEMPGARPLGLHLEGPCLSAQQPGCLDPSYFRSLDPAELQGLLAVAKGAIKRMTIAVELPGVEALLSRLIDAGIAPSLGHTAATFEEVARAIGHGLGQATHTFNAMSGFHHRAPGAAGAVLLRDEILAEVIADGRHVHPASIALLYRLKGQQKMMLVSDAVPPAGMPPGKYPWAGRELLLDGESCRTADGQLAGSATLLDGALRNLAAQSAVPLGDAVGMATLSPARALGLSERKGSLEVGKDADIAIFDHAWRCRATIVGGSLVWQDAAVRMERDE